MNEATASLQDLLGEGRALVRLGQDEAAKRAWLAALQRDPTSLEALTEMARLAQRSGHRSAARTALEQAALCHPLAVGPRVGLGNMLNEAEEFAAARAWFEAALALAPDLAAAHQGLARTLAALGETDAATVHRAQGFRDGWLAPQPYRGTGEGVRVLLLVSAGGGNIPTGALLDDTVFAVTALYADASPAGAPLPPHDLVFNAIADADLCGPALAAAGRFVARTQAPVVNQPDAVAATGRAANAQRLAAVPGLVVPETRQLPRADLVAHAGLAFPCLVRSPGFHTGQHFVRVERRADFVAAIAGLPGEELLVIEPLDARGADGRSRKYRVMIVGGAVFPVHLAVSAHWKAHYFTSDMAADGDARAEEAAFLADMPGVLGAPAMAALAALGAALGLDYAGVDFALAPDGRVLLFEANAGMVLQPPPAEPMWDYRRPATRRAIAAVRALLVARSGRAATPA